MQMASKGSYPNIRYLPAKSIELVANIAAIVRNRRLHEIEVACLIPHGAKPSRFSNYVRVRPYPA